MAQVQVVSKGMRWTQDLANKAVANHQYIKVGEKSGHLLLSGAPGRWKKAPTSLDVYIPSLRVAGNPNVIRALFQKLGTPVATIDAYLAQSYNAQNYKIGEFGQAFNQEVVAYKAWKSQKAQLKKAQGGPSVNLGQLQYFVDQLSQASTVARTAAAGSPRTGSPRATRVKDLATRLNEANVKGKVLDVSKMNPAKGTGIKMITKPGPASKKIGVAGLAIVSSEPGLYAHAVRQLGPQYEQYVNQYNQLIAQKTRVIAVPQTFQAPIVSPTMATFGATSPLLGGVALPTIPAVGGQTFAATAFPITSPAGSPGRL